MQSLPPITDLLAATLDEVVPFYIFRIGDLEFKCWKPDHIAEEHNLRYVSSQVELMALGQQYQLLVDQLNELSKNSISESERKIQVNNITYSMGETIKAMLPLNASYIEALTECKPGTFLTILQVELGKKNLVKSMPLPLFVNTVRRKINDALEAVNDENNEGGNLDTEGKETSVTETGLKLISEA